MLDLAFYGSPKGAWGVSKKFIFGKVEKFQVDQVQTLSRFYPNFIQTLSKLYPNFIQILSKGSGRKMLMTDHCDLFDVPTVRFGPKLVCDIGTCIGRCTASLVALGHFSSIAVACPLFDLIKASTRNKDRQKAFQAVFLVCSCFHEIKKGSY